MTWPLPFVIAHRGASRIAPENTLSSLKKAKAFHASCVECDVQLTRDYQPIIFHDWTLHRTSNGVGFVSRTNYQTIATLDVGSWFSREYTGECIPTLRQWLLCAASLPMGINIEIKATSDERAKLLAQMVVSALDEIWKKKLPIPLISSFNLFALRCVSALSSDYLLGLNVEKRIVVAKIPDFVSSVHLPHEIIDVNYIAELHVTNRRVLAFTVNERERVAVLRDMGVDGVFSDNEELFFL